MILQGEPLDSLPDAWLSWRALPPPLAKGLSNVQLFGGSGLVLYLDGRAEAVTRTPGWGDQGPNTLRRQGTVSAADRAELEKALAGPIAPPLQRPPRLRGGYESETEPDGGTYEVVFRGADGTLRRISYQHRSGRDGESGGEPLHPLLQRIVMGLPE